MAISEPVSRDLQLAHFLQVPAAVTTDLRTLIMGVDYAARRYNSTTMYNLVGAYNAGTGTVAAWPNLLAGEVVDQDTATVWIVQALLNYYADVGAVGATKGTQYLTFPNQIKHNAGATIWAGPSRTGSIPTDVKIGDYVYLDNLAATTLATKVIGFKYNGSGQPNVLILQDNLPTALTGGAFFNVSLSEIVANLELTTSQTTLTTTTVKANAGVTATSTRVASAKPVIAGTGYSSVYTSYRAARPPAQVGQVTSYTSQDQIAAAFVGSDDPESGLGFALARALAPTQSPEITLPAVLGVAVASEELADWQAVIDRVQRRRDWYTLAPLTVDPTIQTSAVMCVDARLALGLNSRTDLVQELQLETVLLSGAGNTVTVNATLTPGFARTVIRDGGVTNPFAGVQAGDVVTIAGIEYPVATYVSDQTVTISVTAVTGTLEVLNSVVHPLTPTEQITAYGAVAQAFGNQHVSLIFPPNPSWNGDVVAGYLLTAAVAGLRGYTPPQGTDRGMLLETGWTVPQSQYEFLPYLPLLADYGVYVISSTDDGLGATVYAANTTDQSEVSTSTEGVVANADAVVRYVYDTLTALLGQTKVTSQSLDQVRVLASNALAFLKNNTNIPGIGAVLISGSVGQPAQNSARLDQVDVPLAITIAAGLENVTTDIVITIAGA